jgi:serine protease AprX
VTGSTTVSTVLRGMQWVIANRSTYNIRVANLSLGATPFVSYTGDPLATGVEMLTFSGIAVVVAAGNGGPGAGTVTTPGDDPFVITVGAIDDNGTPDPADDLLPSWSAQGATAFDALSKPDLAAPGRKMVSLRAPGSTLDTLYPERQVAGTDPLVPAYFRLSGTSMAAPVVAGTIALMLEKNPSLGPAQIKHRLRATASAVSYGSALATGAGVVNVAAAVASADPASDFASVPVSDGFATSTYSFIYGQPLSWRDLTFNGGVDSAGTPWGSVTWTNIVWDPITWQDLMWESFNWSTVSWQDAYWEDAFWETTTLNVNTLGTRGGWRLVN